MAHDPWSDDVYGYNKFYFTKSYVDISRNTSRSMMIMIREWMDIKYDILKHPSVRLTTDGQADPYIHGEPCSNKESM